MLNAPDARRPRLLVLAAASAAVCVAVSLAQGTENAYGNMGFIHVREAAEVLRGNGFGHWHYEEFVPDLFARPTYTLLLCPAVALLEKDWEVLRVVVAALQGVLNALTALAVMSVLARIGETKASRIAAWGVVLHPVLVSQAATLVDTVLFATVFVGAFGLAHALGRESPLARWAVVGLVFGVAVLSRFTAVMLAPALLLLIARRLGVTRRALAASALLAVAAFAVCVPWLLRNHALTGRWMLSTSDGVNLWMGNNPDTARFLDANRSLDDLPARPRYDSVLKYTVAEQVESCDAAKAAAGEFIRERPFEAAVLALRKAGDLWSVIPSPRTTRSSLAGVKNLVGVLWTVPMYLLAVAGVVVAWRQGGESRAFCVAVLVTAVLFTVPHALAWGGTRLRAPLDPFVVGLAAVGAASLLDRMRRPAAS